jgi:hypothetical protein
MQVLTLIRRLSSVNFSGGVRINIGAKGLEVSYDMSFNIADCALKV